MYGQIENIIFKINFLGLFSHSSTLIAAMSPARVIGEGKAAVAEFIGINGLIVASFLGCISERGATALFDALFFSELVSGGI